MPEIVVDRQGSVATRLQGEVGVGRRTGEEAPEDRTVRSPGRELTTEVGEGVKQSEKDASARERATMNDGTRRSGELTLGR